MIRYAAIVLSTLAATSFGTVASAATIGFSGGPIGSPVAPAVEGDFTYSTFSGGLYRDTQGNGDAFDMEGCSSCGGGVLEIISNLAGGLFTFDGADVASQFDYSTTITFNGLLGGISQGTDSFTTASDSTYLTYGSSALAGVTIDQLLISLDATFSTAEIIDNVVVTPSAIPLPASALMLLGAFGGIASLRRRRKS